MRHILLIEDEIKLARYLELELNYAGYQVSVAYDGLTAIMAAQKLRLDLIVLNTILPSPPDVNVYSRLRITVPQLPIILLKDETKDQVHPTLNERTSPDLDIDVDYLLKPFTLEELLVKIRLRLGRTQAADV